MIKKRRMQNLRNEFEKYQRGFFPDHIPCPECGMIKGAYFKTFGEILDTLDEFSGELNRLLCASYPETDQSLIVAQERARKTLEEFNGEK